MVPLYCIRVAGAPFELLQRLETPETVKVARRMVGLEDAMDAAAKMSLEALRGQQVPLAPELLQRTRHALGRRHALAPEAAEAMPVLAAYAECFRRVEECRGALEQALAPELTTARGHLMEGARSLLARYAPFASTSAGENFVGLRGADNLPKRDAKVRNREWHLLLYVQRFCSKNETFSEFGPSGWGEVLPGTGLRIEPVPGILRREAFYERWVIGAMIDAMNADAQVRPEVSPRVNPLGHMQGERFVLEDTGEGHELSVEERAVLARCDGKTPAHQLGSLEVVEQLASKGVLRWELELVAMSSTPLEDLLTEVRSWRNGPARRTWLPSLEELAELPPAFAQEEDPSQRVALMDSARSLIEAMGTTRKQGERMLYAATNPIAEECLRDCRMSLGEEDVRVLERDAAPWFDLWRDTLCLLASRVADRQRKLWESAPRRQGRVLLPSFLAHAATADVGYTLQATEAFGEVKAAFNELVSSWPDTAERELTAEDCRFVRNRFSFRSFDEYVFPSADLQIVSASPEAFSRGDYQWVVAELHPPLAMIQHVFYWACPDKPLLRDSLKEMMFGQPLCYYGMGGGDNTAHTAMQLFDALPRELVSYASQQLGRPEWPQVAPADVEVCVDEATGDVRMRHLHTGADLGSFARSWPVGFGCHPFLFSRPPHTPRLRVGRVVVQRESWVIRREELPGGPYHGTSPALVVAMERLRASRGLPRWIFIRPTDAALPRLGARGREKDVKPICVDLESYPSLEVFHHWLSEYEELEVNEMLPNPEQLPWIEPDGRRCFELRTLLAPPGPWWRPTRLEPSL